MKILVVDDSPVIRNALEDVLVTAGYSVTTAANGIEGLDVIHQNEFDLMFLDIDMPNLSGLQVCRMLRNEPRFSDFPIIMLTARGQKQDQYWGMETGASAYLTKPFDPGNLIDKVREVSEEYRERRERVRAAAESLPRLDDESGDVLFKAGELQETQLFKMTLVNKIFQIATSQFDLQQTCNSIADIFTSVIDFDLGMFLLTEEERIKLFVNVPHPITRDFFMSAKKRMMDEFKEQAGVKDLARDNAEVELYDPERNMLKETREMKLKGFDTVLLETKGDKFGMFAMARGERPFSADEMKTCRLIAGQSSIVIDNVRMYERIKRFAVADGLTGLYNHRYFQEQLEKEYSRARRFNLSLSLIMVDIDHFKRLNDNYGHQQGDIVLKGMSGILRRSVRDIDLVARYGGEEFVVVLPETPKKNAVIVADRIRESLEEYEFEYDAGVLRATASFGVSGHPDDDITTRLDLIAKADEAMYQAKRDGRNCVRLFSTEGRAGS
jgi:two-component system, cell cycle response regulator